MKKFREVQTSPSFFAYFSSVALFPCEMQTSQRKAIESDLFICIGTSLAVFPAADLPLLAKETGAVLVILNNEPTQMDQYADLVINRDISEVFLEISI